MKINSKIETSNVFDIIIKNGEVIDGTGKPAFTSDIGIKDGRILAIGKLDGISFDKKISANGLIVAPGFIDLHTHSDFTLLADGRAESAIRQGVTLEVIGQCGHSCAPIDKPDAIESLIFGYHPSIDVNWRSFDEYLSRLEACELGVNVAALVGHGAIRFAVMDANARHADEKEINSMKRILKESLEAGAMGISFGLEYAPGISASTAEIFSLAKGAAYYDGLCAVHLRNRDLFYEQAFGELLAISRNAGAKLQISHISPKFGAPSHAIQHILEMIRWVQKDGADVAFDIIPNTWANTKMVSILPGWAFEGGTQKLLSRLSNPEERERLKDNPKPMWQLVVAKRWDQIFLFDSTQNADLIGMTIKDIGLKRNIDPHDAVFDLLLEEGEGLYNVIWVANNFDENDQQLCIQQPECGVISDGISIANDGVYAKMKWSPGTYCWVINFLQHYIIDKGLLSLEEGIRRITSLPASRIGLRDRGRLYPGAVADITIFNPEALIDHSSFKEPNHYPSGIEYVLVNGQIALKNGQQTFTYAGRVLRCAH